MTRATLAVLLLVCVAVPARAAVRTLVAIGNDIGLADEQPLRWAEADAARIAEVMVDVGGVSSVRATVLQGQSVSTIERALLEVKGQIDETRRRGERAELVVTYSGHGDAHHLHIDGQALRVQRLLSWLDAIAADATVVVFDACRAGNVRSGAQRGATRVPAFDVTLVEELAPVGRVLIASASEGEVAQESDDLEGAFFTHHLLAGLRGAADNNGDGVVVLHELYAYAHSHTVRQSFASTAVQHPELQVDLRGQGEMVMTSLQRAQASLVLESALDGAFLIADARTGRVLFEVQKSPERRLTLAVPARRLRIQRRVGRQWSLAEIDASRGGQAVVSAAEFSAVARSTGRTRGIDVDPSPWGLSAALLLSTMPAVASAGVGGLARVERRFGDTPVFGEVTLASARAHGVDKTSTSVETDGRLLLGVSAEAWTFLGRFSAGVSTGAHAAWQQVERKDLARLRAAGLDRFERGQHFSVGPAGTARVGWWIPVAGPIAVDAGAFTGVSGLVVDGRVQARAWGGVTCGLAVEL